jgi:hypothetical protein
MQIFLAFCKAGLKRKKIKIVVQKFSFRSRNSTAVFFGILSMGRFSLYWLAIPTK